MATSLFKAATLLVLVHVWFAIASGTAPSLPNIASCTANFLDIFAGCSGTIGAITSLVLGTVDGAGLIANAIIVFLQGAYATFVIAEWLRGRAV